MIFLIAILTFAYFYQAADQNIASRFDLVRALVERHTVWIEGYAGYNTADIVEMHSHIYSSKAPGAALLGVIPWSLFTVITSIFLRPGPVYWILMTYLTTLFTSGLMAAVLCVLVYRAARYFNASPAAAVAAALTLAFGTILFPYATEFAGEPMAAFCIFAAFYLLVCTTEPPSASQSFCAGLLAGWSVLCDFPTFVLAAGVGVFAIYRLRFSSRIAGFIAGVLVTVLLLAIYNWLAFGKPLFLSYEAYSLPGADRFPENAVGFAGITYPRLAILADVLLWAQRGLLFCNPVLILTVPGLLGLWRRRFRPESILITYLIVGFILLNGACGESIVMWGGGTATGPRHMVPVLPFMALTLAFLPEALNYIFAGLALASVLMMVMATGVEPHFPYEYVNPLRDFAWPAYLRGDFGYNTDVFFGGPPLFHDSTAFNLGKLLGWPGWLQLWPLAAFWSAGAIALLRSLAGERWTRGRRRSYEAVAITLIALLFLPTAAGAVLPPQLDGPHGLVGSYYRGLEPAAPPHIVRLDRQIAFDDVAQLGALPAPSCVIWKGVLLAPRTGLYQFTIEADDTGWLTLDATPVIPDPGARSLPRGAGQIYLSAGAHQIVAGERNLAGDAAMRLFWQPPGERSVPIPTDALIPRPVNAAH